MYNAQLSLPGENVCKSPCQCLKISVEVTSTRRKKSAMRANRMQKTPNKNRNRVT